MKSTPFLAAILLLSPVVAALGAPGITQGPWGAWVTETVDASATTGYPSLAVREGSPTVIAHMSNLRIRTATQVGVAWEVRQVLPDFSYWPSIAYDSVGVLHMAVLVETDANRLRYGTLNAGTWTFETASTGGPPGYHSKLSFDSSDFPHVAHVKYTGGAGVITHTYKDASGWHDEVIEGSALGHVDIALTPDGRVHVVFDTTALSPSGVRYAVRAPGGGWTVETAAMGSSPSLGVGSDGVPHIAFHDAGRHLSYATRSGSTWVVSQLDGTALTGSYSSTKVSPDGRVHVAYGEEIGSPAQDPTRAHLKYASLTPSGWVIEALASPLGRNGVDPSMVLDDEGRPHVAHMSSTTQAWVNYWVKYSRPAIAGTPMP